MKKTSPKRKPGRPKKTSPKRKPGRPKKTSPKRKPGRTNRGGPFYNKLFKVKGEDIYLFLYSYKGPDGGMMTKDKFYVGPADNMIEVALDGPSYLAVNRLRDGGSLLVKTVEGNLIIRHGGISNWKDKKVEVLNLNDYIVHKNGEGFRVEKFD
jgi:hypothetical protein